MNNTLKIYFAGGLFSHKDLIGNAMVAEFIERLSQNRYECLLPQNIEFRAADAQSIRDDDIIALLKCDLAIFNFDGTELDSGTVVEYMFAKFADMPSLILRTDFRNGGDSDSLPWNLMVSYYPRTRNVLMNAASIYRESQKNSELFAENIAKKIVIELDELLKMPSSMPKESQDEIFKWLSLMPSFGENKQSEILEALERKREIGLL